MKKYLLKQEQLAMQKQKSHTLCFRFTEDINGLSLKIWARKETQKTGNAKPISSFWSSVPLKQTLNWHKMQ